MLQNMENKSISVLLKTETKLNNPKYPNFHLKYLICLYQILRTQPVERLPILVGTVSGDNAHSH